MNQPTLFDSPAAAAARARREVGIDRAIGAADRIDGTWRAQALAALLAHAREHATFLIEDVREAGPALPAGADGRAWGAIAQDARRLGLIARAGYAPANSSNGSPKCLWALVRVPNAVHQA